VAFRSLRTVTFRNLADAELDTRGKDVFFVGENGQGKTNFLEALYFCSYASSFRGCKDKDLIRTGEKDCSASVTLDSSIHANVNVSLKDGKKSIALDAKRIEDRKELLSVAAATVI
jgi:DNA replication and repair protein RecF